MKRPVIKLMEVCGTHTMAIARSGIKSMLPDGIQLLSGPGCPVCVTPQEEIDKAIAIARIKDVILMTFGDMIRVPGTVSSLAQARAQGADVRIAYSCAECLDVAKENPDKRVVFMGIGFETTSPTVAATVLQARQRGTENFFVLSNFKVIFPALRAIVSSKKVDIDGFICPGHVSVITGAAAYKEFAARYKRPCVIAGFDDIDIAKAIKRLVEQIKKNEHKVEVEYERAVSRNGNRKAQKILDKVFQAKDSKWRGLGMIRKSGLEFRKAFREFDADREFKIKVRRAPKDKGCICGQVLQGIKSPGDCRLFKGRCTPMEPVGPCMVSSEGACAAYYKYGE